MNQTKPMLDFNEDVESFDVKEFLSKYIPYWPLFLVSIILAMVLGFLYMRYAPTVYGTVAKVKIVDESKELDLGGDAMSLFGNSSKINLDNEIEIVKSYRLLSEVVDQLDLDISYYENGNIKTTELWNPPFTITKLITEEEIKHTLNFNISVVNETVIIENDENQIFKISKADFNKPIKGLPFSIREREKFNLLNYNNAKYKVAITTIRNAIMGLQGQLSVSPTGKKSEILSFSLEGQSPERSEVILNKVIDVFNTDGILDRQLVSQRTLDFIDERFVDLSSELDSIEGGKQDFKQENNLSYIEADAGLSLQRKTIKEDEVSQLSTQISLSDLLKNTVTSQAANSLLPVNIGLENSNLNSMVSMYNELAIEREKLLMNVGERHPTLVAISGQLQNAKQNIMKTVNVYQNQLQTSLGRLNQERYKAGSMFAGLPEKEKALRSIERQQSIKENLFLLLLQKREEAGINLAITAPTVKVVDFALTRNQPVAPVKLLVYPIAMALGVLLPFFFLFTKFSLSSKFYTQGDIEKVNPEIPVLAEIPYIKEKVVFDGDDNRSPLTESFRILSTNINYLLKQSDSTTSKNVIYVTSTIKGEGKTFTSLNLSLAYASLKKKVLIIGADLRNPQLHSYYKKDKNDVGLSNFLEDSSMDWKRCISKATDGNKYHDICFSGPIPGNVPMLLSGPNFNKFLEIVKEEYDYVIVDTPPTILITDTFLIAEHADITVYVTKAGYTDKKLLKYSKELNRTNKLKNMAYILNEVGKGKNGGNYNYGYGYGYGSSK